MTPDEHVREVYAHFGLAIYCSQVLEHGIGNTLVYASLIPSNLGKIRSRTEWEEKFDGFLGAHFDKTLGRMIAALKSEIAIPVELESMLTEALKKRNWLAHHYFRDRSDEFLNERGREIMIEELKATQTLFSDADERLEAATKPLREKYGFTDERLEKYFDEYCADREIDI
ncbi:hypothetical protein GCM10027046_34640 [Uliginosibacterium flavum]|uniref:Uncharacterized protein n=1 Tax=Uliginosibacterium flavum TaxID=1396831 RepID=A0ABV2TMI7_9RHOO